uniref:Glutaminase n=1 Tax=Attheya septentrionalis TaxID=420275 RepID=A0A7S2XSZ0_9STRA|mmetsp:Transcript_6254/g.11108  ORF Transcript_6254/g.11108 Transcript_6254/m.11108 type:complete len:420 (+) Transcript_6254:205-1464(+)
MSDQMSHTPLSLMIPLNDDQDPSKSNLGQGIMRHVFMDGKNDTKKRSRSTLFHPSESDNCNSRNNFSSSSGGAKGSNRTLDTEFASFSSSSISSSSDEYSSEYSVCSSDDDGEEELDFFQQTMKSRSNTFNTQFPRVASSPALASLHTNDHERNKICDEQPLDLCESDFDSANSGVKRAKTTASQIKSIFNRVQSMPDLTKTVTTASVVIGNGNANRNSTTPVGESSPSEDNTNPQDLLHTILKSHGFSSNTIGTDCFKFASLDRKDFFLAITEEQVAGYNNELTSAVRGEDIDALRRMHRMGKTLQCCNKFGESIVHMACRTGSTKLLLFLLEEGNVSLRVTDDFGRTPLHDACWSREPDFGLIRLLISRDPDLLLLADKRGVPPLGYVRRDHWGQWSRFLNENRDMIIPRELIKRSS